MSIQLNIGDHTSPVPNYVPFRAQHLAPMRWARNRARAIARGSPQADRYFVTLPRGRSLTGLLADNSIWVNFNPVITYFGEAIVGGSELAVGRGAFAIGRWTVLATLIHELAHINGAPGGNSKQAEEALLATGLGRQSEKGGVDDPWTPYNPNIQG
ncbi:MAG TPA: hypothetical protein VF695_13335 [Sphingomonas sp.]